MTVDVGDRVRVDVPSSPWHESEGVVLDVVGPLVSCQLPGGQLVEFLSGELVALAGSVGSRRSHPLAVELSAAVTALFDEASDMWTLGEAKAFCRSEMFEVLDRIRAAIEQAGVEG